MYTCSSEGAKPLKASPPTSFMQKHVSSASARGNSKYHYYGLRIKAGSSLLRLMEDQQHLAMRQQPFSQKQRYTLKK